MAIERGLGQSRRMASVDQTDARKEPALPVGGGRTNRRQRIRCQTVTTILPICWFDSR
jgi:hypothetical protein